MPRSTGFDGVIGIHTHNDSDVAVANTVAAVEAGATHVQGCLNGYGERCGNANLSSIIATSQLNTRVMTRYTKATTVSGGK